MTATIPARFTEFRDGRARHAVQAALPWIMFAIGVLVVSAANGADETDPGSFEPGDISIGEPIPLPFAPPLSRPADPEAGAPAPQAAATPAAVAAPANQPGGWLGLSIAESTAPGRWVVADVAAAGPAAAAGVRQGDEIRAIQGKVLESADDVSQALTSIAQGQPVRLTTARSDQVLDVVVTAGPRPSTTVAKDWQGSAAAQTTPPAAVSSPAAVPAPPAASPPVASVLAAPPQPPGPQRTATLPEPRPFASAGSLPGPAAASPAVTGAGAGMPRGRTALGVRTVPMDPALQARFQRGDDGGAYVIGVVGDLPASKAGIPPGSVIVSLDNRPVRSPQDLTRLVTTSPIDRPISLLYVLPGGSEKRADVVLQSLDLPLEQALVGSPSLSATAPPTLESGPPPRVAHRAAGRDSTDVPLLREEIARLRSRLDALERRLDLSPSQR